MLIPAQNYISMESNKIKLDIVSDVVCPWCVIGYLRLEKAISELNISDKIEITWQPFELNPNMPEEGQNVQEHIFEKYGATAEDQKNSQNRMSEFGKELDFNFDYFEDMRMVNTRDAHILIDYARENGEQTELNMRLATAFFSERKDISLQNVLLKEIEAVGLDSEEALRKLNQEAARSEISEKEEYWKSLGVSSVPTFIFNRKSALTGAQPVEVFKQVLTELTE